MFYVYVIQNLEDKDDYYLGFSADLEQRLEAHNSGKNHSTNGRRWHIVYYEAYLDERVARVREQKLKRNRRMKKFLYDRICTQFR